MVAYTLPRNIFGNVNVNIYFQLLRMSIVTFILIYVDPEISRLETRAVQLLPFILESSLNYRFTKHGPGNLLGWK